MDKEIKVLLFDILIAVNEIESFLSDRPKEFENYKNDLRTKRAVERNFEIIGEAMTRLLKLDNTINISNPKKLLHSAIALYMDTTQFLTKLCGESS